MLALAASNPVLVTRTFTSSQSFTVPFGVSNLVTASGDGADGNPGYYGPNGYQETITHNYTRRDGSGVDVVSGTLSPVYGEPKPADYYEPHITFSMSDSTVYSGDDIYHSFSTVPGVYTPATTGPASTGFGKTFPGGVGVPASTTSFTNVAVTGGSSYPLVVPSGGSITITYYQ